MLPLPPLPLFHIALLPPLPLFHIALRHPTSTFALPTFRCRLGMLCTFTTLRAARLGSLARVSCAISLLTMRGNDRLDAGWLEWRCEKRQLEFAPGKIRAATKVAHQSLSFFMSKTQRRGALEPFLSVFCILSSASKTIRQEICQAIVPDEPPRRRKNP